MGNEGAIILTEALKSISTLAFLNLDHNGLRDITSEGTLNPLFEALKSNSSLTSLRLYGNKLVASFHSHSIQGILSLII
jgi:hypothetical protein